MEYDKNKPQEELLRKTALRIVKDTPGLYGMPDLHLDADFYCVCMDDPAFFYETEKEYVIYVEHLLLADACLATISFQSDPRWKPTAILCENKKIFFEMKEDEVCFTFEISGLLGKTRTLYIHTILREPGVTLRIEQNDVERRAGEYRKEKDYPLVQIEAARHYIFAMRQLLHFLEIPQYLSREKLGYMLLLGFETNNEVLGDWPPHWHLIFRWPNHCGSQAPHIYLDEQGASTHNLMCIDKIPKVRHVYEKGEWCTLVDMYGRPLMQCRVDTQGGMTVTREGYHQYSMDAYMPEGVVLRENNQELGILQSENDTRNGLLRVHWKPVAGKGWCEIVGYDPLTGEIVSHTVE